MKKLFAIALLVSVLPLAGCPKKKEEAKTDPAPATQPATKPTETPPTPEPAKPEPTKADTDPVKADPKAEGKAEALPADCAAYKELADKLAACEKLGAQRDVLKGEFDRSWKAWSALAEAERGNVGAQCKTAADALRAAAGKTCGW